MKKLWIYIVLVVILIFVPGCGTPEDKSIELTLDNYETYLDVDGKYKLTDRDTIGGLLSPEKAGYKTIAADFTVKGVSGNFNYNDVEVVIELKGRYTDHHVGSQRTEEYSNQVTVVCNIAGDGSAAIEDSIGTIVNVITEDEAGCGFYMDVVKISGSVTPLATN